jgi:hypothetical protein
MAAYLKEVPSGVPGTVTDFVHTIIESGEYNAALMPTAYGAPVKLVSGLVSAIEASDAAADFYGILARSNPGSSGDPSFNGYGAGVPQSTQIPSVVIGPQGGGKVLVKCAIGTPVKGGIVYMRVVAATGKAVGDFEATADGANNVALTGVVWGSSDIDSAKTALILFK